MLRLTTTKATRHPQGPFAIGPPLCRDRDGKLSLPDAITLFPYSVENADTARYMFNVFCVVNRLFSLTEANSLPLSFQVVNADEKALLEFDNWRTIVFLGDTRLRAVEKPPSWKDTEVFLVYPRIEPVIVTTLYFSTNEPFAVLPHLDSSAAPEATAAFGSFLRRLLYPSGDGGDICASAAAVAGTTDCLGVTATTVSGKLLAFAINPDSVVVRAAAGTASTASTAGTASTASPAVARFLVTVHDLKFK